MRLHQPGRLTGREGQLGVADLGQLTRGAVAVQGQQRLGAGDEDEPQPGRGVTQQELELGGGLRRGDPVELVQHQDHRPVPSAEQGGEPGRQGVADAVRVRGKPMSGGSGTPEVRSAWRRYAQNMPAPCPAASVVSQATGSSGRAATQSATSSVFPAPAQPFTRVRGAQDAVEVPRQPLSAQERVRRGGDGEAGAQERVAVRVVRVGTLVRPDTVACVVFHARAAVALMCGRHGTHRPGRAGFPPSIPAAGPGARRGRCLG